MFEHKIMFSTGHKIMFSTVYHSRGWSKNCCTRFVEYSKAHIFIAVLPCILSIWYCWSVHGFPFLCAVSFFKWKAVIFNVALPHQLIPTTCIFQIYCSNSWKPKMIVFMKVLHYFSHLQLEDKMCLYEIDTDVWRDVKSLSRIPWKAKWIK